MSQKDNMSANSRETETRLTGLALMLKEVYIPAMESKKEITHHMGKFIGHIQTSVLQAYGNVTITVPEIPAHMSDEEVGRNPRLVEKLNEAVAEWTNKVKESIEAEEKRSKDRTHDTSSGETEFWSQRSAKFNMLYQQLSMPSVRKILNILGAKDSSSEAYNIEAFNSVQKEFSKCHAKAKDFVKFLTTLERQFKNISRGDLKQIEETLPSLLNGLKLIWTISRHINQTDTEFEDILESISNEICTKVRNHIQLQVIFKQPPSESIAIIKQGIAVLDKWQDQFTKTKMDIETEVTIRRWDFPRIKEIQTKPKHMKLILENFNTSCIVLQEFFAILGNDLKAVTGSSESIDQVTDRVKEQVRKLETFQNDVFNPEYYTEWKTTFQTFQSQIDLIEVDTVALINNTFKTKLNSSEGAFELLSKFKNVKTRQKIEDELSGKFKNVLERYQQELISMETLFKENQHKPPIPKNMPPNSGSIAWARSIITRIKTPIDKFKTKPDILTKYEEGVKSAQDYVRIAKNLTEGHEAELFKTWKSENTTQAIGMLKKPILIKIGEGENRRYKVNFDPKLKVIIREAKFLDRIGKDIPNTIINIALQEKDYMHHIDKLNQLLRGYNSALQQLRPVEKGLLEQNINKLNSLMDKGEHNHNWFSLSIPEFIKECNDGIDSFKETKGRVLQHANNIEKKVQNIENAVLVRTINFANQEIMGITEFSEYFDSHREKIIAELVKDYQNIGDTYLRSIEECTFRKNTQNCEEMRQYYYYWERRIFNAITKMIIRAMAANKALWRGKPLIKMNATYNYPEMSYHPTVEELKTQLDKFSSNILQSAKKFGRWLDGFCKIFEEQIDKDTGEKSIRYTFYDELNQNPVICNLQMEIQTLNMQIQQKFNLQAEGFFDRNFKLLYDKNELTKMQKQAEKSHSVAVIERRLLILKKLKKQNIKLKPTHYQNSIVDVDYTDVHANAIEKIGEWWNTLGKILADIAKGTLTQISKEIRAYEDFLSVQKEGIELFKALLNKVAEIKNISMDMELKIGEAQEQFRVLKMYKYLVSPEDQELVDKIGQQWAELIETANKKDHEVGEYKKTYASITMTGVAKFKKDLAIEYEKYKANGPGTPDVSLDEGLELLQASKDLCAAFQIQKNDNLLSETLFDLEISTYPDLNDMVEKNKSYDLIYDIYKEHRENVKDFSVVAWSKLDITSLTSTAERFVNMVKRLEKKLRNPDHIQPFVKLRNTIEGFKVSIPFIQELKHPAIQERHWKRIMEETGKDLGDINLKTITLSKVFELELHLHQEKVQEICKEAKEEALNEENIAGIDKIWKDTAFDVVVYKKGTEVRGYSIKTPEEIRQKLEDNILLLQSVGQSKYSRSIKPKVQIWEADLNLISDVIDLWMIVQRKWMYLESIFASDDIRMQLPEEAKKFSKTDLNYKKIMENTYRQPNVLQACVKSEGGKRLDELKTISFELDRCQKSLTQYLDSKKMVSPRFYFISDEDLLQILGTSDVKAIQPHMLKLFDNCKELTFGQGNKIITHMTSDEGEKYQFEAPVKPEGKVEEWMCRIDDEMKRTLTVIAKRGVYNYAKEDRIEWIRQQLGMIALVGTQIWWTFAVEDVFRQVQGGNKHAMKNELAKESSELNDLIALVRTEIPDLLRKCVNTLIILDVHARDIVDSFVRDSIMSAKEFEWESQLRFYWDMNKDDIDIRQCTGAFDYCYEYQGLNGRLVITPLTDRCVMTLTTALTFKLGGAPAGPAGTGKTETVKDLAKALALRCVVTNCGETLDYVAMGVCFSGLIQTGFWGCFDEFNRINVEVLSVVSAQIKTVQNGLSAGKQKIVFLDNEMRLIHSIGIYITMNPGYAGRSELPDNLKALFRPVTMVQPDLLLICENMLMSEGFTQAKILAKKMTVLYKLSKEQLSKQYHYDFQLRALKSVLVMAGQLKRAYAEMPEDIVLMRALRDMNMPKFVFDDVPLFHGLIQDLFPGLRAERVGYENLKEIIVENMEAQGLKHQEELKFEDQVNKMIQLFETMQTRHTTMIVGPTGSGKSVILNQLGKALKDDTDIPTKMDIINPKMITLNELYGVLDPDSRDWTDGLLSKIFKEANRPKTEDDKPDRRWIVFDGDVDAVWVENMNSVMDDNRILTLANGDRIRLQRTCAMLFEVYDLQYASPATISRCGMVYVDPKNLGYRPYYTNWLRGKFQAYGETMHDSLKELFHKYVPVIMDRIFDGTLGEEIVEPLRFITPRTDLNLVHQLTYLIDAILPEPEANPPQDFVDLEKPYIFCLVWSVGGALIAEDRDKFNQFVMQVSQTLLPANLYDYYFDMSSMQLDSWEKRVQAYEPPADKKFQSILVPTVDTTRYSWLLNSLLANKKPVMFCGDSGTAKTVTVFSAFRQLDIDKYIFLNVNFSSRTTSKNFQDIIEENIDKRSLKSYGPKSAGKKMVLFIDDLNMPVIDKYGTQAPNALLKFLVERNQLYQRGGDLELRDIVDVQYIGCMSPPGGGNNKVDPRLMSLYSVFNITTPSQKATQQIYSSILGKHLAEFPDECISAIDAMTTATLSLYYQCCEKLPRTPVKFHYIFNLRDLSRVYEGLLLATKDKIQNKPQLIRLWRNECMRVFADRLLNEVDKKLVEDSIIGGLIKQYFKDSEEEALRNPILFGDYMQSDPTDEEKEDPRLYEDLGNWQSVQQKMERMLEDYGFENKPMNLVLFNDALDHVTKIHRIMRFPRGCGLLVGYGGSGKQSLTKLATFVAGSSVWTINLVRNYKEFDFRIDLQNLYKEVVLKQRTFMFTDAHVVEEGFLELINNILTIGIVPGLFPDEEREGLISPLDKEIRAKKLPETKEFRWQYFVNRCRENMHILLCMSPAGDTLRLRCRNFPGLVSNTSIDWFFPWPEDALADVATYFLQKVQLDEELRKPVTDHIVMIHLSVQKYSVEFDTVYKRKNYSTPKNYLDFIQNYMKFLADKRKICDFQVRRLEGGLTTLENASAVTKVLSEELAVKNEIIANKKVIVEQIIFEIQGKSEIAAKQQKAAAEKKAILSVQQVEIMAAKAEAAEDLKAAAPALAAAQLALTQIQQKDIVEIKALANPPESVKQAITVAFHYFVRDSNDSWPNVKQKMLGDMQLLANLKSYDISKAKVDQSQRCKALLKQLRNEHGKAGEELQQFMNDKSKAAGGLFKWATSTDSCFDIFQQVEPKRKKAEQMAITLENANRDLAATEAALKELNDSLAVLNAEKKVKVDELQELEDQSNMMTRKLNAASKLITGLGSEQVRWSADMERFKVDKIKLIGDCLSASSFLSYSGPFNFILRQKMIFGDWKMDLVKKEIPNNEVFKLETFLTDEVIVSRWASEGLPSDELSIQNGILTTFASRWPLCIDPQMQAVNWIKIKESRTKEFKCLTFNSNNYIKTLELAIKFGSSILFESIDTEIDPMIDPVLEKNITMEAGVEMLTMGDQKIEFNPEFRMFMTTKIANPNYTPEIFGKTMIINFSVTLMGLRDQLLNEVVGYERPELEAQRKQLIVETSANKAELKELEETLLSELSKETDIPLVDNVPLIQTLDLAKTKSVKIEQALINAALTSENINMNRESYKGVAKRGAILCFALFGLSAISDMYEYSLNSYMTVFMNALDTSKKDNVLQARLKFITDKLTQLVYEFTCMGIFEKHKLMFSFQMTTMIMDGDEVLNKPELDFFLKGNTSLDEVEPKPFRWLTNNGWKDAVKLDSMGGVWEGLLDVIKKNEKVWKDWYDLEAPEMNPMPCGFDKKLDKFQALLLCKIFRNDRCINAIKNFIMDRMSDIYVKSPPIDYEKIYKQSTEKTPIIFILSPGADPQNEVQRLVESHGPGMAKFKFLALGQGMGDQAKEFIESGAIRGWWVMLQNCHLLTSWLKTLESTIEGISKPDKGFRLWLTTNPIDPTAPIRFPLGILQRSLKVVTEPPDGLSANIKQAYSKLNDEILNECPKREFKSLVYVLSFFHATIQERKKFGKIGWNVNYDFNDSDFRISLSLISLYLNKAIETNEEELPWSTLRYLIGEAMYGGRVTDDYDRRVLNTYLKEFMGDFIFDSNQKFFFSKSDFNYVIPTEADTKELIEVEIEKIPLFTNPGVFGLHSNAEIQYFSNSVKELWLNTLMMQTSEGGEAGGINREEYIGKVASDIQDKLPELFDVFNIKKKFEVPQPTQIVLLQELERFNILLELILQSLSDLKRALVGEIGMSQALDDLANCIFKGFVPPQWLRFAPQSLKNLVNWFEHFLRRYKQYKEWDEIEEPKCIWLSGLHIPESYLTALVQTTCRSKGWALDKSTLYTIVLKERDPKNITKRIDQGTYIQGMFIEGARWNTDKDCLDYQRPKELIEEMPLVQIVPVEANKLKLRGTIRTPVYVTQARRNAMGVGLVFESDLKTDKHISHWVLQGVCLVLNTD